MHPHVAFPEALPPIQMAPKLMTQAPKIIDVAAFRGVFSNLAGAVSVLSVGQGDERTGLTATSVSAFSAEPPTVSIHVNTSSSSWQAIQKHERFCINVLAAGQEVVADNFAGRGGIKGPERYADGDWIELESGAPVLEGAVANIDCILDEAIVRHSHAIVIGRIVALRSRHDIEPLLYWRRDFYGLQN